MGNFTEKKARSEIVKKALRCAVTAITAASLTATLAASTPSKADAHHVVEKTAVCNDNVYLRVPQNVRSITFPVSPGESYTCYADSRAISHIDPSILNIALRTQNFSVVYRSIITDRKDLKTEEVKGILRFLLFRSGYKEFSFPEAGSFVSNDYIPQLPYAVTTFYPTEGRRVIFHISQNPLDAINLLRLSTYLSTNDPAYLNSIEGFFYSQREGASALLDSLANRMARYPLAKPNTNY